MPNRFIVVHSDKAETYRNAEEWDLDDTWHCGSYIVDTRIDEIVFSDHCEPEDATLYRHYGTLVDLLNDVSKESE